MKYVIIQGDGMGDVPLPELGGRTPLDAARTPNMDRIAARGRLGLIHTIPEGLPPGSDVGNLSLFGYDPRKYYTGRSPLEAAAMGIELGQDDVAFRLNLVTLSGQGADEVMDDFAGGHIDSAPAAELVQALSQEMGGGEFRFYPGLSYRHLMVWHGGTTEMQTTPPHDISGKPAGPCQPSGPGADRLREVMARSRQIFAGHPVNAKLRSAEKKTITLGWLWGQGRAPHMPTFRELYRLQGAAISAVDLVRGVATYAGFEIVHVPGATGFLDTDYRAKGEYALRALDGADLVFVHIEAPDEAGHMGDAAEKVKAIEAIDEQVIGPMLAGLPAVGAFKIVVTSDHATPVPLRTHVATPVPFAIATGDQLAGQESDSPKGGGSGLRFNEADAAKAGAVIREGHTLISHLIAYPE
ncbi:MAG: cofactor-independent phosphoglycerate mutase [SAR324 cluster bacterium]|nr:cofactor-independent phosphoglycerate mutase [SAR324 cluster bacterium]